MRNDKASQQLFLGYELKYSGETRTEIQDKTPEPVMIHCVRDFLTTVAAKANIMANSQSKKKWLEFLVGANKEFSKLLDANGKKHLLNDYEEIFTNNLKILAYLNGDDPIVPVIKKKYVKPIVKKSAFVKEVEKAAGQLVKHVSTSKNKANRPSVKKKGVKS